MGMIDRRLYASEIRSFCSQPSLPENELKQVRIIHKTFYGMKSTKSNRILPNEF